MGKMKARLSVFLCILFVLPAVLGFIPRTSTVVHAATSPDIGWAIGMGYYNPNLKVEVGQKFHIGDFAQIYDSTDMDTASSISSVTYTSSDSSVASCNNGIIKTLKSGTTVLTVSYQGKSKQCTLIVVDKGTLHMDAYKSLDNKAVKILKLYGNKISGKNQYQVYNLLSSLKNTTLKTNLYGMRLSKVNGNYSQSTEVVAIHMAKAYAIDNVMNKYVAKKNPIGTPSSKTFKITSVNAQIGQNQFTIDVKNRLTANQIFAIKAAQELDTYLDTGTTAKFQIYVRDKSTKHIYSGIATVTQGSNIINVQMHYLTLKKNRTYQLLGINNSSCPLSQQWTLGKKFKAK